MLSVLQEVLKGDEAADLTVKALGVRPLRVVRQALTNSGKAIYRIYLRAGQSVVLRISNRPATFAFTQGNIGVLRALGLAVQTVLATGRTEAGGSYIILNWLPGRDLVHELGAMNRDQMTRLADKVVDCQRRLGRLPRGQRFGWAPIGRRAGNLESWTQVFGDPIGGSVIDDGTPLGGLRARLCSVRSRIEPYFRTVQPTPFLDDLTTRNVLVEQGALTGIIDVDFVCYGDPLLAIGATLASLAADVPPAGAFYGDELIRFSNPDAAQRQAIRFYAALWAIGSLRLTDAEADPARTEALTRAADTWLREAQAEESDRRI
jgi:aminoglycoside phosphotransferase (APT) family kinase protein